MAAIVSVCLTKYRIIVQKITAFDYMHCDRSEGPAQVFLLVLWKRITVSYDNMCHLNNLKVARCPLPLPGDLSSPYMAGSQQDYQRPAIKNHKDSRCEQYRASEEIGNTMACEQTFAWLSRYKKILSAMPKTHHHFYLHRMVVRRNRYISQCCAEGRRPVQPKVRHTKES